MSHSMPASSRTPMPSRVHGPDAGGMRERAVLVEAVGHRQRLAVIGDRDVFEARFPRRVRHRRGCRLSRRFPWCACGDRRAGRRDRQAEAAVSPARLRFRRASPAVRAESSRGRARRTRLPRSAPGDRGSSPSVRIPVLNTPYSFSFKPRPIARSRNAMLCAFDPVKYCSAAPRLSGGTSRRSA